MMRLKTASMLAAGMLVVASITGCNTLLETMGGMEGVERFNYAFGPSLLADPAVSKFLDVAAVEKVKKGVANEVARVSGAPLPNEGVDLRAVLAEENMDGAARKAFKASAKRSAELSLLSPAATRGLMKLIGGAL